jgi:peptidoglycan hydrolase-like protein with peptidoglycan-binding domain
MGEKNVVHIIIAALFSVSLIFGMSGVSLPLQQEAYAQPTQTIPSSSQMPPPTSICNSNPSTLKFGLKGAKVVELQSLLVQLGYKSLLGKSGTDGEFGKHTLIAVKKFQQDHKLPMNGIVTPSVLRKLCTLVTSLAPSPSSQPIQISVQYQNILGKLQKLWQTALTQQSAGYMVGSPNFAAAVRSFSNELEHQLKATDLSRPIPPSPLAITVEALKLWVNDDGKTWGRSDETADFGSTCESYAKVGGGEAKCNIYVAEVIYRATSIIHKAHAQESVGIPITGKYFPYRAEEWADTSKNIPYFRVDIKDPKMGDIWAARTSNTWAERNVPYVDFSYHVGIYLGEYNGVKLYISARADSDGVYGIGPVQYKNGIQVKELIPPGYDEPKGGVFRELCVSPSTSTISIKC